MLGNFGNGLSVRVLNEQKIAKIHEAALTILDEIGVAVLHQEGRELLDGAGAVVGKGNIVKIPPQLVMKALGTAPKSFIIYDRSGKPRMQMGEGELYFGTCLESLEYLDPYTGKTERYRFEHQIKIIKVFDYLSNLEFIQTGGEDADVDPKISDRICFKNTLMHTEKPICFCIGGDDRTSADIIEAAAVVAGGYEELAAKPFIFYLCDPVSPRMNVEPSVGHLLTCAEKRIPVVCLPYCTLGGTAPVTFAGALAQCTAEVLSCLVIHQLKSPGAPFIFGAMPTVMDMRTTVGTYGSPELAMLVAASAEIASYYGLPFYGTAGTTDAKSIDAQAIMEATMSCMLSALGKTTMAHDVGFMYHSRVISPELMVITNEIINMIKPFRRGVEVNTETLALDVMRRIPPGGHYLNEQHTFEHFKECWYPELLDRSRAESVPTVNEKAREKTIQIIENHILNKVPEDTAGELEQLELKWKSNAGLV
ncbi:trimethylamine methyltransferase family protein [Zhaonella formicivorans]|uniref:trimethylamine methyltransferase family protein n=1 Tax=Zhaonella formicivorans TaxID=2528593 RepID=UPI0010E3A556|nr:trimethylamine methyltransferase family protein [Zhaonella formicivorans]